MRTSSRILICAVLMGVGGGSLWAQDAVSVQRQAQNKLLARRAARVDAIRKLAERIKGFQINSETLVRDFVTEYDEINTSLMTFIRGMREKRVSYMEDGTCQVTMEITLREAVVNLRASYKRYYKGDRVRIEDFQKMLVTYKDKIIKVTGSGVPRPEPWEIPSGQMIPVGPDQDVISLTIPADAKAFWFKHCTPQGRLMAVRAARVDAQRRLAERIKGVHITSETTVRDFVAESDQIETVTNASLLGARERGIRYHADELIVEVRMAVKLRTVYATLKSWAERHYKGDRVRITQLEKLTLKSKDTIIRETGMGVPPARMLKRNIPAAVAAVAAVARGAPPWIGRRIRAVGNGVLDPEAASAAQARLMAQRAAELDARRKLAEQINGLMITSNTSVVNFVALNDQIETAMMTFQQGAMVVPGSEKMLEDGTAQVTVEIDLRPLWDMVIYYQRNLTIVVR